MLPPYTFKHLAMTDIKRDPDTAEPDLPPSYDETNIPEAAALTQQSKPPSQPLLRPPPLPLELPALAALRGKRVILASASPRRKQLLAQVNVLIRLSFSYYPSPPRRNLSPNLNIPSFSPPQSCKKKKKNSNTLINPHTSNLSQTQPPHFYF